MSKQRYLQYLLNLKFPQVFSQSAVHCRSICFFKTSCSSVCTSVPTNITLFPGSVPLNLSDKIPLRLQNCAPTILVGLIIMSGSKITKPLLLLTVNETELVVFVARIFIVSPACNLELLLFRNRNHY